MALKSALFASVLLATTALAAPSRMSRRLERRKEARSSHPLTPSTGPSAQASNSSHTEYSSNWAGAVYDSYPAGSFSAVTGTFVVPTPQTPSGGSGTYSSSAWVGIDGDTCGTAILQTGVDFTVDGGSVSYDAWYEWYPDYAYDFSGIDISAGDTITVTVTASSTTSGSAVITNESNGQQVSQDITSSSALCEQNAEWIVEDFEEDGGLVPFANFGTVTFSNAAATLVSGGSIDPSGADTIDIEQNGEVLTSVTTGSSVTVTYTGS